MKLTAEINQIKKELDDIDDAQLLAVIKDLLSYAKTKTMSEDFELTPAHKKILDERKRKHTQGKSKSLTWEQVKSQARKQL